MPTGASSHAPGTVLGNDRGGMVDYPVHTAMKHVLAEVHSQVTHVLYVLSYPRLPPFESHAYRL